MSQDVTDMVWEAVGIRSGAKLVLLRLAGYADDDGGSVFPSVGALCAATGLTAPSVRAAMAELQAESLLVLVALEDPKTHRPREYRIALDRLATLRATPRTPANFLPPPPQETFPHPRKDFTPSPQEICGGIGNVVAFPPQNSYPLPANFLPPPPQETFPHPPKEFAPSPQETCPIPANSLPHPRKILAADIALKEKALSAKLEVTGEEGGIVSVSAIIAAFDEARVAAFGETSRRRKPAATDEAVAAALIDQGVSLELCEGAFLEAQARRAKKKLSPIDSLSYFSNRIKELVLANAAPFPQVAVGENGVTLSAGRAAKREPTFGRSSPATRNIWRFRLIGWRDSRAWMGGWGERPGEPDCEAPADLIAEILPQPELL